MSSVNELLNQIDEFEPFCVMCEMGEDVSKEETDAHSASGDLKSELAEYLAYL